MWGYVVMAKPNGKNPKTVKNFKVPIEVDKRGVKVLREKTLIPPQYKKQVEKVLISPEVISRRVKELAKQLTKDYNNNLYFIVTLKGSGIFFADLIRELTMLGAKIDYDYVCIKSYMADNSSEKLDIRLDVTERVAGKKVIIVEDIVDTGFTMIHLTHYLKQKGAKAVSICTLMNKPERRKLPVTLDYVGFSVSNMFVIGYGMDYDEFGRGFPYIAKLRDNVF